MRTRRRPTAWNGFVRECLEDINESKFTNFIRLLLRHLITRVF